MTNQGPSADSVTSLDPNSLQSHQGHVSSYQPSAGPEALSWAAHGAENSAVENGNTNTSYHHNQSGGPQSGNYQDVSSTTSLVGSSSSVGAATVPQEYNVYSTYQGSTDPYGYNNTGYAGYYNNYLQQPNQSYPQPVGAYQNTGAPYQPLSTFQNTGSYPGTAPYSTTYYNPGDYQTSGGYQSSNYTNQTNLWNANYANYAPNQYPNYAPDSSGAYSSQPATASQLQYQHDYKQWADYYSQTEVSCAPGTENMSVTSASNAQCAVPGGYIPSSTQPAQPSQTSWNPGSISSQLPSVQAGAVVSATHDDYKNQAHDGHTSHAHVGYPNQAHVGYSNQAHVGYSNQADDGYNNQAHDGYKNQAHDSYKNQAHDGFKNQAQDVHKNQDILDFQNTHINQLQPHFQKPVDPLPSYSSFLHQQKSTCPPTTHLDTHQVTQAYLTTTPVDTQKSKMQIPTNPRIALNLPPSSQKTDRDSYTASAAAKPAYISVSVPKPNDKESAHDTADLILKPSGFPPSLRGYVERALARCKDDVQMTASQAVMKEMITAATTDGTLFTRDWDTEPLFQLPSSDVFNKNSDENSAPASLLKFNRSPRRTKSRWEPLPDEKLIDKGTPVSQDASKYGSWAQFNNMDKQFQGRNSDTKDPGSNNNRFISPEQRAMIKNFQRVGKRQRVGSVSIATAGGGDASSDSDKEQNLTAYYAGAMALANSPEERKKRESRSKRFEKGHGHRTQFISQSRPKNIGAGSLFVRRTDASVLSQSFEDSNSRAVEDIDWDSLTVKGTCQEIEKRYLRLTSAPDPATVRPEEVLEKALHLVRNSQKNYLYKCDQLKSIRQDLTVQRIHNELTVKVYETHARLALEVGDLPEYNQCQSQLKALYAEGIGGCHMEFSAYNLLCAIMHSTNNRDLLSSMSRLSTEAKNNEAVKHALSVRAAFTSGNYIKFFRLYKIAPNLNACLMDLYVEKMRYAAVRCMSRSYRPTVPVTYITHILGFSGASLTIEVSGEDADGLEECVEWLKAHGACLIGENIREMQLDSKASCSSLYMPEPEDAVSHGDTSLAVNDFLTRT